MIIRDQQKFLDLIAEAHWWANSQSKIDVYFTVYSKWDYCLIDGFDTTAIFCYQIQAGENLENVYDEIYYNLSYL